MENAENQIAPVSAEAEENTGREASSIIPDKILEDIPEEERGMVQKLINRTMVMGRENPIARKITSEHITKIIENSDNQDKRDRAERKSDKNYEVLFLSIGLVFLAFLIIFLKDDKELLYKIIIAIISFIGGFGIGKNAKSKRAIDE